MLNRVRQFLATTTDSARELAFIYITVITVSATLYSLFEQKDVWDSLWWAVVTAMTVGYGDSYPVSLGGRVVAMFLMHVVPLFVIPLVTARLASALIVNSDAFTHGEQEELKRNLREIREILRRYEAAGLAPAGPLDKSGGA